MIPEHRRSRILAALGERQRLSVNDLAVELGVSRETVRRDLARLQADGLLRKVHGGALPLPADRPALDGHTAQQGFEGRLIGRAAAALVRPGDSLFIDAGPATAGFAAALAGNGRRLTVITNALQVAVALGRAPGEARLHLLGGALAPRGLATAGAEVIERIAALRPDCAVLGAGAIDAGGQVYDFDPDEAAVARAMIRQAREVVLLADHTRFGRRALARVCHLRQVHRLVTDRAPVARRRALLRRCGVELVVASPED
ncbi:MAG: DeoR/GlpR transcriptional regulator [Rhodospirillaceae bacterium]|nr:DeoR/GlpR transcriptional regulator [Rhodospirillaceae bacterium]